MQEPVYRSYVDHLIAGNRTACGQIVTGLIEQQTPLLEIYTELFQRSLHEVGCLWESNKVSVATEHLATAMTEWLMTLAYPRLFSGERSGRRVVIACAENEYHQVGAKMVADIFELRGWDSFFLGANTPVDDLMRLLDDKKPNLLGLSISIYFNMPGLLKALERIRARHAELGIIVGGQAFRQGGIDALQGLSGVSYVPTLEALETLISRES
jgi:methanogenic corrinoid protein MtbC1